MLKLVTAGAVPELYLYGIVAQSSWWNEGSDIVSAQGVLDLLGQIDPGSELVVRINSEGGDVFEGVAIYNALARRHPHVEVQIDALAASIASVIAMAGDKIVISGNAMMMIHQAWTIADGNADDLAKVSETLRGVDDTILNTYEARLNGKSTREQIAEWVKAETWLGPEEAVERGFADEVGPLKTGVTAQVRAGRFKHAPAALIRPAGKPDRLPEPAAQRASSLPAIAARLRAAQLRRRRAEGR